MINKKQTNDRFNEVIAMLLTQNIPDNKMEWLHDTLEELKREITGFDGFDEWLLRIEKPC